MTQPTAPGQGGGGRACADGAIHVSPPSPPPPPPSCPGASCSCGCAALHRAGGTSSSSEGSSSGCRRDTRCQFCREDGEEMLQSREPCSPGRRPRSHIVYL